MRKTKTVKVQETDVSFRDAIDSFVSRFKLDFISQDGPNEYTLLGDRNGDDFYTPRQGEEDDDWPDFDDSKIIQFFKGKGFNVSAYDSEKGYFSVVLDK